MSVAYKIYKEIIKKQLDLSKIENSVLMSLKILENNTEKNEVNFQNILPSNLTLFSFETDFTKSSFIDAVELLGLLHQKKTEEIVISKTNLRKQLGIFYTPFTIAKDITDTAISELENRIKDFKDVYNIKFLEPCVGIGIFTIAYIESLFNLYQRKGGYDTKIFVDYLIKNIYACDIDKEAIDLYKKVLISFLRYRFNIPVKSTDLEKNIYAGDMLFNTAPESLWDFKKNIKLIFPEVFKEKGGFDVVITNPPYRLLKATSTHFDNEKIKQEQDINKRITYYIQHAGSYRYANEGILNYYKLFVEEILENYSNNKGIVGLLVPITLLSDKHTSKLRKRLLEFKTSVIKTIPETNGFFPDIAQSFCHFVINKSEIDNKISILSCATNQINTIPKNYLSAVSDTMSIIPIDNMGWQIITKMHRNPLLKEIKQIINLRGELDLTFYKKCIVKERTKHPLIRGAHIGEYFLKDSNEFVDFDLFSQKAGNKIAFINHSRLACQQISNIASRKRLKFCLVSAGRILGNSCNFITLEKDNSKINIDENVLLGILNSLVLDWRFKIFSTNNHINNYELGNLPIPFNEELNPFYQRISNLVKQVLNNPLNIEIKDEINALVFYLFNLTSEEVKYICKAQNFPEVLQENILKQYKQIQNNTLFNHVAYGLSELDLKMVKAVPSGGNWKNIPTSIPSKRLEQIRRSGGRTTLYGRLDYNKPSYTISTYFTRPGNGTFIHPDDGHGNKKTQHRLISIREAARLQSFSDSYRFLGPKNSISIQIGNAVPPLLSYFIAQQIKKYISGNNVVDLFCGAGGLSHGFKMAKYKIIAANDSYEPACKTYRFNNPEVYLVEGDVTNIEIKKRLYNHLSGHKVDVIIGGPPCQGFSHAGKRMIDDPRNHLFKEFVKIVKNIKPQVFLMENVPGILTINNGKTFEGIKESFKEQGYYIYPQTLNAAEYGVPQKRKRVFILGSREDIKFKFPTRLLDESQFTTVKEAINDLPYLKSGDGKMLSFYRPKKLSRYQELMKNILTPEKFIQDKLSRT